MPNSTNATGIMTDITNCYVIVPSSNGDNKIVVNVLPDISDAKSASYNDEPIMGRTMPLKTYSHSENRSINMTFHFIAFEPGDVTQNIQYLRVLASAVYPRTSGAASFLPPPVCRIKCGSLLSDNEICVVLKSYSVKYPTDVPWDGSTYIPYKFDVDTTWDTVYTTANLPGQDKIIQFGS